jgi:hypothetical protein
MVIYGIQATVERGSDRLAIFPTLVETVFLGC